MMAQRSPGAAPCVQAAAEGLPFRDGAADASLAVLTIHHWRDQVAGLAELRRIARRRVVAFTWDPAARGAFWLTTEYFPEMIDLDLRRFPTMDRLRQCLGAIRVTPVPIPHDCQDGFLGAYWRRPEAYLDPVVRGALSSFAQLGPERLRDRLARLAADLASGHWEARHGTLRNQESLDLGYRLVTAEPA
jgi:SAM-dependent methyltransferase